MGSGQNVGALRNSRWSQQELKAAFNPSNGWNVVAIKPDRVQTNYHEDGAPAWLATIKRIEL